MISLIKSSFYNETETKEKLADFIKKANFFSMNTECTKFEQSFAKKQGRKFAVYVNSGSMANLVLIQSLLNLDIIKKNDKVGVSALTWATNIMPLIQLGLQPILIDCEISTLNISPQKLNLYLEENKLDALFITNVLGLSDDIAEIKKICNKKNIIFLEDNCESLGSKINNQLLGNFGFASTFSFFVGHHISTIEGGMICTDSEELYDMLVMVRAHGWDRNLSTEKQHKLRDKNNGDDFYSKYLFYDLAYNARPTEINGFLGNIQINYWDEIVSTRESNYKIFLEQLKKNNDFIPTENSSMDIVSSFALPIICKTKSLCNHYKQIFDQFAETRPIITGDMSRQPFFIKYINNSMHCKNAEFVHDNGFYIGNNPELTENEMLMILNGLTKRI